MKETKRNINVKVMKEIKEQDLVKVSGGDFDVPVDDYIVSPEKPTPVKRKPKRS